MASMGSILSGAFGLLRERPGAVAIWAVIYTLVSLGLSFGISFAMYGTMMPSGADFVAMRQTGIGPMFALIPLLYLGLLLLAVVLTNAVFRAMLRPQEGGFAFLRLGMDELRMLGLIVLVFIAAFVAVLIGELVLALVVAAIGLALGQSAITMVISFLLFAVFFCALIWAEVRLSLIFPLTFYRRKISVDAAWALTRGRFWTLFGAYFVVCLIVFVASCVLMWGLMGAYLTTMMQAAGDPERMQAASEAFTAQQLAMPITTRILYAAVGTIFAAFGLALGPGLLASATRELLGDGDEAAVFAAESDGSIMD